MAKKKIFTAPTSKQQEIFNHIEKNWGKESNASEGQKALAAEIAKQLTPGVGRNLGRLSGIFVSKENCEADCQKGINTLAPLLYLIRNDDLENPLLLNLQRLGGYLASTTLQNIAGALQHNCTLHTLSINNDTDIELLDIACFRDVLKTNFTLKHFSLEQLSGNGFSSRFKVPHQNNPIWGEINNAIDANNTIDKRSCGKSAFLIIAGSLKGLVRRKNIETLEEAYASTFKAAVKEIKPDADDQVLGTLVTKAISHPEAFLAFKQQVMQQMEKREAKRSHSRTPTSTPVGSFEPSSSTPTLWTSRVQEAGVSSSAPNLQTSRSEPISRIRTSSISSNDDSPPLSAAPIQGRNAVSSGSFTPTSSPVAVPPRKTFTDQKRRIPPGSSSEKISYRDSETERRNSPASSHSQSPDK
jgi:hypothetical protein